MGEGWSTGPCEGGGGDQGMGEGDGEGWGAGLCEGAGEGRGAGAGDGAGAGASAGDGAGQGTGAGEGEGEGWGAGIGEGAGTGEGDGRFAARWYMKTCCCNLRAISAAGFAGGEWYWWDGRGLVLVSAANIEQYIADCVAEKCEHEQDDPTNHTLPPGSFR